MSDVKKQSKKKDNVIVLRGRGIHSGAPVGVRIYPRDAGGIVFRRVDLNSGDIVARWDNVGDTKMRNTTIGCGAAHVQTVEHLMAALFIAGVQNALIEIDGPETPILDGSADLFFDAFSAAGVTRDHKTMPRIVVKKEVVATVRDVRRTLPMGLRIKLRLMDILMRRKNDGFVKLAPNGGKSLDISATLVYAEKIIGRQSFDYVFDGTAKSVQRFVNDIARARTFGKYSEWEYLKAHGMGRGADATNVIALNDAGDGTLNALHWADEFVRHKIIDAIGDMYTAGGMVCGKLTSYKGSHAMNNIVLKKLFSNPDNYVIITSDE